MTDEYKPIDYFRKTDSDYSSERVRDMPYGKPRHSLSIFPETLTFMDTRAGFNSAIHTILVTNNGYDTVTIKGIEVVGDFKLVTISGSPPLTTVTAGQIVPVSVVFSPRYPGKVTGGIYFDTGDAAGAEFVDFIGVGLPPGPTDPELFMLKSGGTFTGPVSMDLGTIAENLPNHPDNPTRGTLPFAPRQGGISIHGTQLRLWADMTADPADGDYDADMASQSNMYLVAGGGIQLIPSTNAFLPWTPDGAIQSGGSPGRLRIAADMIANYIQSGGNYSGSWYKDLILCRYQSAAPWIIMDESESGNVGIGYLFPKHTEPAANGQPYETWWIKYRLHVIDHAVDVMMIESTGQSARLNFHDIGTTDEVTIGSNNNELVFRTYGLNRLRIGYNATYPGVTAYHSMGLPDFTWKAGYFLKVNMPHGGVPSGLSNGDMWTTTAGVFARINGATIGPLGAAGPGSVDWASITGKPSTFPPSSHTHPQFEVDNLISDLGLKAPLDSPSFTGSPLVPTADPGANNTQIASTAFVTAAVTTGVAAAVVGYAPLAGATFTGKVTMPGSDVGGAGFNYGASIAAPTNPVDGDLWFGGGALVTRQAGATYTMMNLGNTQTVSGNKTWAGFTNIISGKLTFNASDATRHRLNITHSSTIPAAPVDGDLWTTTAGLFARINGATVGPFGIGGGGGGISDAPSDGKLYARFNATWDDLTDDFAAKAALAGATFTGKLTTMASAAGSAGLSLGVTGTAPSSPVDGDIWISSNVFNYRDGATTRQAVAHNTAQTISGIKTFSAKPIMTTPTTSTAAINLPQAATGINPSAPVNGDLWINADNFYARVNGTTKTLAALEGGTFTGKVTVPASVTGGSGFALTAGAVVSAPVTGDFWMVGSSLFYRGASVTYTLTSNEGGQTFSGAKIFSSATNTVSGKITFNGSAAGGSTLGVAHGAAPSAPVDGDIWSTTAGGFYGRVNGVTKNLSIHVGTTAPASPITNDLWLDTN